jgi:DNA/RNA endonuclease YhcR with UshA esterase domain
MRALVPVFGLALMAAPALAETIAPDKASDHVGQIVTIEGTVGDVHTIASARVTFIDIGGQYPNNAFTAVILAVDAGKFPNVDALNGKIIDITGKVQLYKGKPEMLLNDAAQLKAK